MTDYEQAIVEFENNVEELLKKDAKPFPSECLERVNRSFSNCDGILMSLLVNGKRNHPFVKRHARAIDKFYSWPNVK